MLRIRMMFPFLFLLCCSTMVMSEDINTLNQIEAGELIDGIEGRACGGCGGGTTKPTTVVKPDIHDLLGGHDLHGLIVGGLGSVSLLIFNILGILLLVLLLKNLLSDSTGASATDPYYYAASPSSYADPLTYHRRSSTGSSGWSWKSIQDPLVSLAGTVTNMIDNFEKYNTIEKK